MKEVLNYFNSPENTGQKEAFQAVRKNPEEGGQVLCEFLKTADLEETEESKLAEAMALLAEIGYKDGYEAILSLYERAGDLGWYYQLQEFAWNELSSILNVLYPGNPNRLFSLLLNSKIDPSFREGLLHTAMLLTTEKKLERDQCVDMMKSLISQESKDSDPGFFRLAVLDAADSGLKELMPQIEELYEDSMALNHDWDTKHDILERIQEDQPASVPEKEPIRAEECATRYGFDLSAAMPAISMPSMKSMLVNQPIKPGKSSSSNSARKPASSHKKDKQKKKNKKKKKK